MLGKMLDQRADGIKNELDEARSLRDEAQSILASYERKQKVQEQAARIVEGAKLKPKQQRNKQKQIWPIQLPAVWQQQKIKSHQHRPQQKKTSVTQPSTLQSAQPVTYRSAANSRRRNKLIDAAISDVEDKLH